MNEQKKMQRKILTKVYLKKTMQIYTNKNERNFKVIRSHPHHLLSWLK